MRSVRLGIMAWMIVACGSAIGSAGAPDPSAEELQPPPGWGFSLFPAIFSTPETGFGGGAGLILTYRSADLPGGIPPHSMSVFAIYTEQGQTSIALTPELYLSGGAWYLQLKASYADFPSRFYGVGSDAPREAEEEYTIEGVAVEPWVLRRFFAHLRAGPSAYLGNAAIRDRETGGLLDTGAVRGHAGGRRAAAGCRARRGSIAAGWAAITHTNPTPSTCGTTSRSAGATCWQRSSWSLPRRGRCPSMNSPALARGCAGSSLSATSTMQS